MLNKLVYGGCRMHSQTERAAGIVNRLRQFDPGVDCLSRQALDMISELASCQHSLDQAWVLINALGGCAERGDEYGRGVNEATSKALAIIESLGGMDPALREAAALGQRD
jgi:hypothetical protein